MKFSSTFFFLFLFVWVFVVSIPLLADDDDHDEHRGRHSRSHKSGGQIKNFEPVNNKVYQEECGSCHFAYQPALLPQASWVKLMAGLDQHFGEEASLNPKVVASLKAYLIENSTENSRSKEAREILESIGQGAPIRLTTTKFFKHEHDDVKASVIARKSILSWANCEACHSSAERGVYDEKYVRIPR